MSRKSFFITMLLSFMAFSSCERDDLCTPDQAITPRLIIVFKDQFNPTENKAVSSLQVREIGSGDFAPLDSDGSTLLTEVDSIAIPLRTNDSTTSYDFLRTMDDIVAIDNVDFTYALQEEYVSRACGFRVVYDNLTTSQNGSAWISSVMINETQITDNTSIHVEVRH